MGKEDELALESMGEFTDEMSRKITGLPEVNYGRCREIIDSLDIRELTGNSKGIRLVDLKEYSDLNLILIIYILQYLRKLMMQRLYTNLHMCLIILADQISCPGHKSH